MKVTLIAATQLMSMPDSIKGTEFDTYVNSSLVGRQADTLAHFAGRACYQSWEMPNEKTSTNMGYLKNILNQGHFSVLEHATATFYVEGVSRNLTHELVRHRHLSYSELSQRYVDMQDAKFVVPPAVRTQFTDESWAPVDGMQEPDDMDIHVYQTVVDQLLAAGYSRKQAREAARFYLPSGMETKIVVSGNHRAWRDMLHKRYSVHADAEIREFATLVLAELKEIAPATYQDFPEEPFQ